MARMKFLCDAERCIECNGCVTACKNANEVPWGVNRRRVITLKDGVPGEKSISVACMHCTDAPCAAVCPVDCFYTTADGIVLHDKDLCIGCGYCFYACPFGAPQYPQKEALVCAGKWINAPSVPAVPCRTIRRKNIRNTAVTELPRASYRPAPRCARPRPCWRATATWWPIFTASASPNVAGGPRPGAGRQRIRRRVHN